MYNVTESHKLVFLPVHENHMELTCMFLTWNWKILCDIETEKYYVTVYQFWVFKMVLDQVSDIEILQTVKKNEISGIPICIARFFFYIVNNKPEVIIQYETRLSIIYPRMVSSGKNSQCMNCFPIYFWLTSIPHFFC